jgi:hypothetical protein
VSSPQTTASSPVFVALSSEMETPSSSTTTPSPLLGYLRPEPVPSSSKIANGPVDMAEVRERQQAVQKFLAGAEMSKVCTSPRSTDQWIRRRVHFFQTPQPYASASQCMRVYARILYRSAFSPLLNAIINASSFSSCSLLAPCAHVSAMLHTRLPMTCLRVTYAILKPIPLHSLFRTHALVYSSRLRPGRVPWAPLLP